MSFRHRGLAWIGAALTIPALMLAGCGGSGIVWRMVSYGRESVCLPVATSRAAHEKGLMGVRDPLPLVFSFTAPNDRPAFWMKDTPEPLVGAWIAASDRRVLGFWHGQPYSLRAHPAPAAVSYVIEFGRNWWGRLPRLHDQVSIGRACPHGHRL